MSFSQDSAYSSYNLNACQGYESPNLKSKIEEWVMDWQQISVMDSDWAMQKVYGRVLNSLRNHPFPIRSREDLEAIEHFNVTICLKIERHMEFEGIRWGGTTGGSGPISKQVPATDNDIITIDDSPPSSPQPKQRKVEVSENRTAPKAEDCELWGSSGINSSSGSDIIIIDDLPSWSSKPEEETGKKKKRTQKRKKVAATKSAPLSSNTPVGRDLQAKPRIRGKKTPDTEGDDDGIGNAPTRKRAKKYGPHEYVPRKGTGAYAILVALGKKDGTPGYKGYMFKKELMKEAEPYCDSSFYSGRAFGEFYTAWSCMSTLHEKQLVFRYKHPPRFQLTDKGREMAANMIALADNNGARTMASRDPCKSKQQNIPDVVVEQPQEEELTEDCLVYPKDFELVLLIDHGETNGKRKNEELIDALKKKGIRTHCCRLALGDFVWVYRSRSCFSRQPGLHDDDLILPYVVERKRADDLGHSIKDGRYREQKFRLGRLDFTVIYLIEAFEFMRGNCGVDDSRIQQAITNTQIVNGFQIQETASLKETCAYLVTMTRLLLRIYGRRKPISCSVMDWPNLKESFRETYLIRFSDFSEYSKKHSNWTVKQMFIKHLLKMRGLTEEKVHAIVRQYESPRMLINAYGEKPTEKDKEMMLASIRYGTDMNSIGPDFSRIIYQLYG